MVVAMHPLYAASDRNGDGRVDAEDLLLLQEDWHSKADVNGSSAPERGELFRMALDWHRPLGAETDTPTPTATPTSTPVPTLVAGIERVVVSPRLRDQSADDVFDEKYHGETVVAIGQKVYLRGVAVANGPIGQYTWTVASAPAGSTATIAGAGELVTFRPDREGDYQIRLAARDGGGAAAAPVQARVFAARYVGTGSLGDNTPNVGLGQCAFCHPGNHTDWLKTEHAQIMPEYLDGKRGPEYPQRLLEYHTVGYHEHPDAGPSQVSCRPPRPMISIRRAFRPGRRGGKGLPILRFPTSQLLTTSWRRCKTR
ncbi:hypothetical protein HS125_09990 [bacterium]|nr:hypothetical protein [bacterium]